MTTPAKRTKSFGGHKKKATPLSFKLNEGTDDEAEFDCHPRLPGAALIDFAADATSDETSRSTGATLKFFETCLDEDEHEKFDKYIRDPKREIEVEDLAEIVEWLVEEYTARPTE